VVAWSAKDFRSYGYRPVRARLGVLKIDEAEAAVVRRICRDYLGGRSPRDIAVALNKGRISGPRGGAWNASTIGGSRTRRNGILQTSSTAAASSGTGSVALRTPRRENELAGPIRRISG
jgi:hypothetical protein